MYDPAIENAGHPDQHYPMKPGFNQDANGFPKFFLSICVRYYTGSDMSFIELDTDAQQCRVVRVCDSQSCTCSAVETGCLGWEQ